MGSDAPEVCQLCRERQAAVLCNPCDAKLCSPCWTHLHASVATVRGHTTTPLVCEAPPPPTVEASEAREIIAFEAFNAVNKKTLDAHAEFLTTSESLTPASAGGVVAFNARMESLQTNVNELMEARDELLAGVFARSPVLRQRLATVEPGTLLNIAALGANSYKKLERMASHYEVSEANEEELRTSLQIARPGTPEYDELAAAMDATLKYKMQLQADRYAECMHLYTYSAALRAKVRQALAMPSL
ncbi:hypothetical protein SPRG_01246 [Saprolegnia parasitica CBS 223.65]|uniref:B box-type domain-containing protein n=1 Tax=Saprolegnia parasitica (strain CBS 223.65) TaxID=695850 RepID=A0A067CXG8_SAPPC|nr:hypothetical protein SPRG_01246 [Saprolegnia parasitica CBS 223.65]KDO33970.1 hypothetical protein SPRG_01246 [Saprolegnia parasitica CBS 223.65]|eukprot:XP_012194860.1 hypothetical protein SPRG_01246 [Saprolegnia parasitica CBS 223.65]